MADCRWTGIGRLRKRAAAGSAKNLIIGEDKKKPVSLTLDKLRSGIPDSWEEQRKLFLGE